jgi:sec-independent protein translocase protein TatC
MGRFATSLSKDVWVRFSLFPHNMLQYHISEIRYRLMYYTVSFLLSATILWQFKYSLLFILCPINLMFTELYEAFSCFLWLSVCSSFIINLPLLAYSIVHFIIPGLYKHESKELIYLSKLFISLFMSLLAVYMVYLLPFLVSFFTGFMSENLTCSIKLLDFSEFLLVIIYLSLFTLGLGLVSVLSTLENYRKMIYMLLIIVVALLTPPDVFSLLFVSIPSILFMEVLFFFSQLLRPDQK